MKKLNESSIFHFELICENCQILKKAADITKESRYDIAIDAKQ